jgi:hypothetical protein
MVLSSSSSQGSHYPGERPELGSLGPSLDPPRLSSAFLFLGWEICLAQFFRTKRPSIEGLMLIQVVPLCNPITLATAVLACVRACVCVCVCQRERFKPCCVCVCVCVCDREREIQAMPCVCDRERDSSHAVPILGPSPICLDLFQVTAFSLPLPYSYDVIPRHTHTHTHFSIFSPLSSLVCLSLLCVIP